MNRVFRVGIVYINTNNVGDIVIFDTAKHLVLKSLERHRITNYEIIPIDMGEKVANTIESPKAYKKKQRIKYADSNEYVKEWKSTKLYYYFSNRELPKLKNLDVIIFAGGGLIKFHQQFFHMYIDEITAEANKYNVPVIFNAVGIEGYEEHDIRCQMLKTALNRKCVKAISTRDNLELLQEKYVTRRAIKVSQVCDPALWAKETYGIKATEQRGVGLGVIRPEIFELYGVEAPKQTLLDFYKMIITELEEKHISYKLFTNGARRDYKFIDDIRTYMNRGEEFNEFVEPIPKSGKVLTRMINKYERIVTCRMHAAIIAYSLGVPAVSVVWNKKLEYFADISGQPENLIFSKDFKKEQLVMEKILKSTHPTRTESYKNSDYLFIKRQVQKYYRIRYVVKGRRYIKAKRRQFLSESN